MLSGFFYASDTSQSTCDSNKIELICHYSMNNIFSFLVCLIIGFVLLKYRISYPSKESKEPLKLTTWDAYGYYLHLPAMLIYQDVKKLSFQDSIDNKYNLSGGKFYQANIHEKTGNYVFKYLGGIAILHLPVFIAAHVYALNSPFEADGFSAPYQNAIGFGVVLYAILALFILRKVLLKYYSDSVTSLTLILLVLATNAIQYISIDSAQSHAPIFLLYCIILWLTQKWHEKPSLSTALLSGFIIGLATISRPTEAIMVLIPILWNTHNKEAAKAKWDLVKANLPMVYLAALGGILGILPQLIYWQYVTGFFIYDVGSAWRFLSPFFRVLFGFEKGWFIYTPVTIFFVLGFFYLKDYPFKKSVLKFCLLNIWVIISWSDWKYGGSYYTRALMQSYPVFAFSFTAFIQKYWIGSNRYLMGVIAAFLIGLNLFQIQQNNTTTRHYYDMNHAYYGQIFMNSSVSTLQKSLLDNPDWISNEEADQRQNLVQKNNVFIGSIFPDSIIYVFQKRFKLKDIKFLKVTLQLQATPGLGGGYIVSELLDGTKVKENKVRLSYPQVKYEQANTYSFYIEKPADINEAELRIKVTCNQKLKVNIQNLSIEGLGKVK